MNEGKKPVRYSLHIRLYREEKFFGPGVARILQEVAQHHSLRTGAANLDMAYSKAWKLIKTAEQSLGYPLLETKIGGKGGGGALLTPQARRLLVRYLYFEAAAYDWADRAWRRYFAEYCQDEASPVVRQPVLPGDFAGEVAEVTGQAGLEDGNDLGLAVDWAPLSADEKALAAQAALLAETEQQLLAGQQALVEKERAVAKRVEALTAWEDRLRRQQEMLTAQADRLHHRQEGKDVPVVGGGAGTDIGETAETLKVGSHKRIKLARTSTRTGQDLAPGSKPHVDLSRMAGNSPVREAPEDTGSGGRGPSQWPPAEQRAWDETGSGNVYVGAVIMASGYSRRMGCNKLLLPLGQKTVIEAVMALVRQVGYAAVVVVSQYDEVLALAEKHNMMAVKNWDAGQGKSSSIRLGLAALQEMTKRLECPGLDGVTFFTGDQVMLTKELLQELQATFMQRPNRIVFPEYEKKLGSPGIFPADLIPRLRELEGEAGGITVALEQKQRIFRVPVEPGWLGLDFDTQDAWQKVQKLWLALSPEGSA